MDDLTPLAGPQGNDQSLYGCVLELEQSERKYHEQLNYLSDLYILHLKTCVVSGEEMDRMLLTKIKDMIDISSSLFTELSERLKIWDEDSSVIGDIFRQKTNLWEVYGHFASNLESALNMYDEKMGSADFAALVSLKQGLDHVSLRHLILLPIERLKVYKDFFDSFLEKTVMSAHIFNHPDFSDIMACKNKAVTMIPAKYEEIVKRKQVEDYRRIESMLGDQMALDFTAFIKHLHEEPATSKRWKKKSYKNRSNRLMKSDSYEKGSLGTDHIDIGGKKFREEAIAPDILNALKKDVENQVMVGMVSPKRPLGPDNLACVNYVTTEDKVKVRWENEVHNYTLILFKQCLIFSKVRGNKSMKISRIVNLRNMWVAEYNESIGFGQVEKTENAYMGGWLGAEGWTDDELLHRVVFHFPNVHVRGHWFTLLQRYIKQCRERATVTTGTIKLYFKNTDSRLSLPGDSIWQGMSCQTVEIGVHQTVEEVIKQAVSSCQMTDNAYTLTFIILQNTKIVYEEQLIWTEMPLLIQNDTRTMFTDPKTMQPIYILRHDNLSVAVGPAQPRQRANTLTQFFRRAGGRGGGGAPSAGPAYSRLSTLPDMQLVTLPSCSTGKMFGLPIRQFISSSEEIPAPLLDILLYLYTQCYDSEGIFRKPGSRAVQRQLEDKLDQGGTVDWISEQSNAKCYLPNVASSLLKNYFRSLPDGLFPKHLFPEFERWRSEGGTDIPDMEGILARISDTNMVVIRHLFHVLTRIVEFSSVNLMTSANLGTCIGPSLITWPEDANALLIHADQYRAQTPSAVVTFLLENVTALFGALPPVLSRNTVKDDEVSLSRRSKLSSEGVQDSDSEEEGDKNNLWLRTLLRSSLNEHNSTSSSMFVEIGSPTSVHVTRGDGSPSPSQLSPIPVVQVVNHTVVKQVPKIHTIHSIPLLSSKPQSAAPEECDIPEADQKTPTETSKSNVFRFSMKKNKSSKSDSGNDPVRKQRGGSLRKSRKSKKQSEEEKKCSSSISDISSEDEISLSKRENMFTRNTRVIREKAESAALRSAGALKAASSNKDRTGSSPVKKNNSFSGKAEVHKFPEKSEVLKVKVVKSSSFRETRSRQDSVSDDIQKIKEHPVAKRVLVKHKLAKIPIAVAHRSYTAETSQEAVSPGLIHTAPSPTSPSYAALQHCTALLDSPPSPGPAKEGHALVRLVSSLEELTNPTNPRLAAASSRRFGGSIGTESGTSSNDDESVVEQESYV